MIRLADIAPRLARARDAWLDEERRLSARRRFVRGRLLDAEWAVAHCELQLVRARTIDYMKKREQKLARARERRDRWQAEARELGIA